MMKTRTALAGAAVVVGILGAAAAAASGIVPMTGPAATAPASAAPPSTAPSPAGVTLRPVDGGPDYYSRFTGGLPTDPAFFPLGVWLESVVDRSNVTLDAEAGLNTYVELTADSDVQLARDSGMYAIPAFPHASASGFVLSDEVDMWAGPGNAAWSGKYPGEGPICSAENTECGYTIQKERRAAATPGAMLYANYGKGVAFWESDEEALGFFNQTQDLVSADTYWFTDPYICARTEGGAVIGYTRDLTPEECRLAANYGWTVERIRKLNKAASPVWAFIEVGHPFQDAPEATTITGPQIRAAVWSSLIHGARGVIYFNHSFGGQCPTQHVLRDCKGDIRQTVTDLNKHLKDLAPVLNAPFLDGATTVTGAVDVATKLHNGKVYVFAGANKNTGGTATFTVKCGGSTAVVINENRTVPIVDGTFTDTFADGNAVHLYSIDGGTSCGH